MIHEPLPQTVNTWSGFRLIPGPKAFFARLRQDQTGIQGAVAFLILTAAFSAAAGLLAYKAGFRPAAFGVLFANAVGMCVLAVVVGFSVMVMCFGGKTTLKTMFKIYAFSTGATLIFSWIPSSLWFTEPWKWWLIYTGLTGAAGLTRKEAGLVVLLSIAVIFLFFQSLIAIMS